MAKNLLNSINSNRKIISKGFILNGSNGSLLDSVRNNLTKCRSNKINFFCDGCGSEVSIDQKCGIKICDKCSDYRKWKLLKKYDRYAKIFTDPKLLTLTIAGYHDLDRKKEFDRYVTNFFRRIKRAGLITFGIRSLEIKKKNSGYYFHYHCIVNGKFIYQKRLSNIWKSITKTSFVVDIRKIARKVDTIKGVRYVLKYAAKPIDFEMSIEEYVNCFYKVRLVTTFGSIYGLDPEQNNIFRCNQCGSFLSFIGVWSSVDQSMPDLETQKELMEYGRRT